MGDTLALLGRVLLSVIFILGGYAKLTAASATIGYFNHLGLPVPPVALGVTVFVELVIGLALLFGLFTRPSSLVLAVWSIATALVAHTNFADSNQWFNFLKNVAICGGMLHVAAFGPGRFSLDAMMRTRRAPGGVAPGFASRGAGPV